MGSAQSRYYPAPRKGDRSPVTVSIEQLTGTRRPSPGGQGRGQTRPLTHPMCARQEVGWSRHYGGSGNLFREGSQERRWRAHVGATEQIPGQSLAAGRRSGYRAPGSQTRSLQPARSRRTLGCWAGPVRCAPSCPPLCTRRCKLAAALGELPCRS